MQAIDLTRRTEPGGSTKAGRDPQGGGGGSQGRGTFGLKCFIGSPLAAFPCSDLAFTWQEARKQEEARKAEEEARKAEVVQFV